MSELARYLEDPTALVAELVLENGHTYGEQWQDWQRELFAAIFARDQDGRPRHRLAYSERRRGESKTADGAAALLVGPPRHRSFAVAADLEQSGLVLDSIRDFRDRTPLLGVDLEYGRWLVRNPSSGSELRILSADDRTSWGIRPRMVLFDEFSLQPHSRLWNSMWSAVAKRRDGQLIALSMAGSSTTSICWKVRELARTTPGYWFQSRAGSEPAPWLDRQSMAEQERSLSPAEYARYWCCVWAADEGAFFGARRGGEVLRVLLGPVGSIRGRAAGGAAGGAGGEGRPEAVDPPAEAESIC